MKVSAGSVAPLALLVLCTLGPRVQGEDRTAGIVKKGSCPLPPSYTDCKHVNETEKQCSTDQQCPGEEKCCNYGCGLRCKKPLQVKEGSCASFDRSVCLYTRPLPDACQSDSQCPGTQRCCCRNCRRVCAETVKAGMCPAACKLPLPDLKCRNDADCPGRQKCCSLCGYKCMDPQKAAESPGVCPVDPQIEKQCGYLPPPRCSSDSECGAGKKCCLFGCGVQCVKALPEKPGVCPEVRFSCMILPLPRTCDSDNDCGGIKKCCRGGCGYGCTDPASTDYTGFCPAYKPVLCDARFKSDCSNDAGCKADEKCCNMGCKQTCVKSQKEKPGACPFIPIDVLAEDMCNKCNEDKDCPGNEKCCSGGKGRECRKPNQEIVKTGACPTDTVVCKQAEPDQCTNDSNCTGNQRCCYFHCGLKCKDPIQVLPKPDDPRGS